MPENTWILVLENFKDCTDKILNNGESKQNDNFK